MAVTALPRAFVELNQSPPPSGAPVTAALRAFKAADSLDAVDGGIYRVSGDTKISGTPDIPVSRRVLLCDQLSGRVVRGPVWSDPVTGAYAFERIRMGVFYVLSFDHTGAFRAVVADGQIPEAMP